MGKSYRRDNRNDNWRRKKQEKWQKKGKKPIIHSVDEQQNFAPHNTGNEIGGINDYAYQM